MHLGNDDEAEVRVAVQELERRRCKRLIGTRQVMSPDRGAGQRSQALLVTRVLPVNLTVRVKLRKERAIWFIVHVTLLGREGGGPGARAPSL